MSVTPETFQESRGWLKEEALLNMPVMLVTDETFQDDRSPLKERAMRNMSLMSVTLDRSGASVAWYTMRPAPSNASCMVVHSVPPPLVDRLELARVCGIV